MVGRSLRILLVSDKHYYKITPFLAALRHSDGVDGVEVVRYVGSFVSGLEGARINTVFIDPLPPTANSLDQATRVIECTREQFPEVVFVICSTRETILNFRAETGNKFQRFYDLDYERVHSPESPELQDVLRKCRADCEAKYRRRYAFDIALSFAGEQRDLAEQLAAALRDHGVRVFYDNYEDL